MLECLDFIEVEKDAAVRRHSSRKNLFVNPCGEVWEGIIVIHTMELIHPIAESDIRRAWQCITRNMEKMHPDRDLENLTRRMLKSVSKGDGRLDAYREDERCRVTLADYDTSTKFSSEAHVGSGINSIQMMRLCTITYADGTEKAVGMLKCSFYLIVQLNPRVMLDSLDEYTIHLYEATDENNEIVGQKFSHRMRDLFQDVPGLQYLCNFGDWNCHRVDYTCNMRFEDDDTFELFMKLVHKTSEFTRTEMILMKDKKLFEQSAAEGNKSYKSLFYDKYKDMSEKKGIDETRRSSLLPEAKHVVRFEQQCRKEKVRALKRKYKFPDLQAWRFLREDIARDVLLQRYDKMVGDGDFYKRKEARAIIRKNVEKKFMQKRLIQFLQLIARTRHVATARSYFISPTFDGDKFPLAHGTIQTFHARTKQLRNLGINPVLIVDKCPVEYLRNPKHFILES